MKLMVKICFCRTDDCQPSTTEDIQDDTSEVVRIKIESRDDIRIPMEQLIMKRPAASVLTPIDI